MKLRTKMLLSRVVDPTAIRVRKALTRARVRKPQPWQCRHSWQPCPIVITGEAGRFCPRCTALETRCDGQPIRHPESMAILLPQQMENALVELDEALWPNEAV